MRPTPETMLDATAETPPETPPARAAVLGSAAGLLAVVALVASSARAGVLLSPSAAWLALGVVALALCAAVGERRDRRRSILLGLVLVVLAVELLVRDHGELVGAGSWALERADVAGRRSLFDDANERAAVLAAFAPLLAAFGLLGAGRRDPLLLGAAALAGAVLASGSRGGMLALALGGVLPAALLALGHSKARSLAVAFAPLGLLVGALSAVGAIDPTRGAIWRQARRLFDDVPLGGAGLGAYRRLVPEALPTAPWTTFRPVHDAHRLDLDLALAGGWPALVAAAVAVVCLLVLLARRVQRARPADPLETRREAAAWLGVVVAHLAWSAVDSAPPGSPAFAILCALVGLALGFLRETRPATSRLRRRPIGALVGVALVALLLLETSSLAAAERARRAALLATGPTGPIATAAPGDRDCGLLFQRARWTRSESEARAVIDCSARDLGRLAALFPGDAELARHAAARRPLEADAWRWAARVEKPGSRAAVRALWRAVALDPRDGRSFLALGDALSARRPRAALEAYRAACRHGDPGHNGCLRAGRLAIRLATRTTKEPAGAGRLPAEAETVPAQARPSAGRDMLPPRTVGPRGV